MSGVMSVLLTVLSFSLRTLLDWNFFWWTVKQGKSTSTIYYTQDPSEIIYR